MKITVTEFPSLAQQQIPEESFQIDRCIINTLLNILIIGPYQGIAEIPGMVGKKIVVHIKSD